MEKITNWLERGSSTLPSGVYWNDSAEEEAKAFDIRDGHVEKLFRYLERESNLKRQFDALLSLSGSLGRSPSGHGIDLGAGVGWTSALLSRVPEVLSVHAVDFSRHRIDEIAPLVFRAMLADERKIVRVLGSFYEVKLPESSLDFCFFSQAFHHADDPRRLLREVRRILRPSGVVLVMGETPIGVFKMIERWGVNVVKRMAPLLPFNRPPVPKWFPRFSELFPADDLLGDHFYRPDDYRNFFQEAGFSLVGRRVSGDAVFVATPMGRW